MKQQIAIIGGGPGGYSAALQAAREGADVTLIEKKGLGGTCLHYGCIPSKIMKHSAELLEKTRRGKQFGLTGLENLGFNMAELLIRKQKTIQILEKGIEQLVDSAGIRLFRGTACIKNESQLQATLHDGQKLEIDFDKLIIATGSHPRELKAFPFDGSVILSSNDILDISKPPASIIIIGGGIIGCEFAFIMRAFGAEVTVIESLERLLPLAVIDEDVSKILQRQMKKNSISLLLNTLVDSVAIKNNQAVVSTVSKSFTDRKIENNKLLTSDMVLVCIGRGPNTDNIGLENINITQDEHGWIKVDQYLQTSNNNIFAIGDVLGPEKSMLAHVATKEGKIAAVNCMTKQQLSMDYTVIPTVVFSHPEIGSVGISEQQAIAENLEFLAKTIQFRTIGMAHVLGEIDGIAKIIAEKKSGKILGIHIIGPHSSDIIAEGALAIKHGCTVMELSETIHAHPTLAEILMEQW